jgi:lysophospholipase
VTEAPVLARWAEGGRAGWITADDGVRLRAMTWAGGARGTVLILQGRTEWCEKYAPLATAMTKAGYTAAAVDFRGQGFSDRLIPDRRLGHVDAMADYQRDLAALLAMARDLPRPLYLVSHSMGGAIALRALHQGVQVAAAAFSAPMWGIRIPPHMRPFRGVITRLYRSRGWMLAPAPTTRPAPYALRKPFAGNKLTRDRAEWDLMRAQMQVHPDLQVGGPTVHWLEAALAECAALRALPPPPVPALIAWGARERIADRHAIRAVASRWPGADTRTYPGARHEILMETPDVRDDMTAAILALFARAGPAASSLPKYSGG